MMLDLTQELNAAYNLDSNFLSRTLAIARKQIKQISIPKRTGGFRVIRIPPVESKVVQKAIVEVLSRHIQQSEYATAYFKGASIRKNAERHLAHSFLLRLDIKDFFPSIHYGSFKRALKTADIVLSLQDWHLIRTCCFDVKNRLSIGFPSSPYICNVVMIEMDKNIAKAIQNIPGVNYTRYSDDLILSAHTIDDLSKAKAEVIGIISSSKSPKLNIHYKKTRKMSVFRGNAIITGVKITSDSKITVHPSVKADARFLLNLLKNNKLNEEGEKRLTGIMSYIKSIDPILFNKLYLLHFDGINKLRYKKKRAQPVNAQNLPDGAIGTIADAQQQ